MYTYKHENKKFNNIVALFFVIILLTAGLGALKLVSVSNSARFNPNLPLKYKIEQASSIQGGQAGNKTEKSPWDGPILYHFPKNQPIHFILVEKMHQRLHLYKYNGTYKLIKTYSCATGERIGDKKKENDRKTPEGIYFNVKSFWDTKVTIFGDRAFGLNYPDPFDKLEGNGGSGIFIHGSNKKVKPFSTRGCVAMDIDDLADLDKRIDIKDAPVIICEQSNYRFNTNRDLSENIPLFKKAMIPDKYSKIKDIKFESITVLSFKNKAVSNGKIKIKNGIMKQGFSRLYLSAPGNNLMVMVKRQWNEYKLTPLYENNALQKEFYNLVQAWQGTWESKLLDMYISKYHSQFTSSGKDIAQWRWFKRRLNKKYRRIKINISNIKAVKIEWNIARVLFNQEYKAYTSESLKYSSKGYKVLEFRKENGNWKIFREESFNEAPKNWTTKTLN